MRDFLIQSCPYMIWLIASFHVVLMLRFFNRYNITKKRLFYFAGLVAFGLAYDAAVLCAGTMMQAGPLLEGLSRGRFILHGALIPLLLPICAEALDFNKSLKKAIMILTIGLMLLGMTDGMAMVPIEQHVAGVARYSYGEGSPEWALAISNVFTFGMIIPLIAAGVAAWIKQKNPRLFLAGALMFFFSALGPATGNFDIIFYIGMYGEVCMMFMLWLYADKKYRKTKK